MKQATITAGCLFASLLITATAFAQGGSSSPNTAVRCGIWYDYDNAGNRIKRYYDCKDVSDQPTNAPIFQLVKPAPVANKPVGTIPPKDIGTAIQVYPNPTTGSVHVRIPASLLNSHYHLYDGKGAIVTSGEISDQLFVFNIGNLPPASYVLVIYSGKLSYKSTVVKL